MIDTPPTSLGIEVFSELMKAVRGLQRITISQNPIGHTPFSGLTEICPKLIRETEALSNPATTQHLEIDKGSVIEKWKQFHSNPNSLSLSVRDYKRFCWVPEVVSEAYFRELVIEKKIPITLPSLRGLVYCYHDRFKTLCRDEKFNLNLKQLIAARSTVNGSIKKWHEAIECLVGELAPSKLATKATARWSSPEEVIQELDLNPTTAFAQLFATELVRLSASHFEKAEKTSAQRIIEVILRSPLVAREEVKAAIGVIILSDRAKSDKVIQDWIIGSFLRIQNLKDPRIYPENWAGIDENAKKQIIQWLSIEDIKFFFELLLKDKHDNHGRKAFWLNYADRIVRSQALISTDDIIRHNKKLEEMKQSGRIFGAITNSVDINAFALDFGAIVVVEIAAYGHACYIYESEEYQKIFSTFWADKCVLSDIKRKSLAAYTLTHSGDWQSKARAILADYGVRRG